MYTLFIVHQRNGWRSLDQNENLKVQTSARIVRIAYRLWLPFLINSVVSFTNLPSYNFNFFIKMYCLALPYN